ncbi:hypothetical protein TWF696_007058 [Orbilia brochopaga]|uniref:HTH APSES-type domain-containing protein n=1 Tax=Orbilia brochopaga TaxID=3140254 RepID=A0AAV9US75_9PEZI
MTAICTISKSQDTALRYTFTAPDPDSGRDVIHSVLWDYETGHVRISPMFKSSEFDALRKKVGGNIEAQGFWIPYLAAKAMCSRFCYGIRYALSPIFGNDFPTLCERERTSILAAGKAYGSEETLQIEDSIVQAVKAKQAVVEWQIYVEEGVTRSDRQEKLPSVEEAWKRYLVTCKGLSIPPRLSYPEAPGSQVEEQIEAASILMELKYGHFWPQDVSPSSRFSC